MDIALIGHILLITLILFLESFVLFFPILQIIKNKTIAFAIFIPISISSQILFGYFFYCIGIFHFFPYVYFSVLFILNIYSVLKIKKDNSALLDFRNIIAFFNIKKILVVSSLIIFSVYSRFYDSISTSAPGAIDTLNHIKFLNDLMQFGYLQQHYYAPGFHIFLYPLTIFTSISDIYRFAGPATGLITLLSIYLLTKKYLKPVSQIFLILLSNVFIYNQLTLQTISFFSSSLTFIFLIFFILLLSKENRITEKTNLWLLILSSSALAITVPYFYIGLIPGTFLLLILSFLFREKLGTYWRYVSKALAIFIVFGFFLALGHVFLQTKVLHKSDNAFPKIRQATIVNGILIESNNYTNTNNNNNHTKAHNNNHTKAHNNIGAMCSTFFDIMSIKNIRPFNNMLAAGAYAWILISLIGIFYAAKKNILLIIIFP